MVYTDTGNTATRELVADALDTQLEVLRGERAPAERFDPKAHGLRVTGDYRSGEQS